MQPFSLRVDYLVHRRPKARACYSRGWRTTRTSGTECQISWQPISICKSDHYELASYTHLGERDADVD